MDPVFNKDDVGEYLGDPEMEMKNLILLYILTIMAELD
jgi:hypothetical protein